MSAVFGDVLGWNLFILLTYLAAGAFAYLWLRELGLPRGAALVGGLVFALAPYRVAQSAGHLRGPISTLLPLALWAFERSRRGSLWWLVGAGAALASIPFSDVHLALGAIPFFALYAVCRSRDPRVLAGAALATAVAVGAALLVGDRAVSGSIGSGGRTLREVSHYSADGLDFVTRHPRHGLESFVFLGWLTPLLALAGLGLLLASRRYGLALALAVGLLVPVLLAFGTNLPLYSFLWHHLPPLRYPRVPERQMPVACLALAALAAVSISRLRWPLAAVVAVVAVGADLRVSIYEAAAADAGNRAYAALRSQPPGRLLELPVFHPSVQLGSIYPYYDQEAERQRPGGYSTIAPQSAALLALRLEPLNCGDWRPGTRDASAPARSPLCGAPFRPIRGHGPRLVRVAGARRSRLRRLRPRRRRDHVRARPATWAAESPGAAAPDRLLPGLGQRRAGAQAHGVLGARLAVAGRGHDARPRPDHVLGPRTARALGAGDRPQPHRRSSRPGRLAPGRRGRDADRPRASPRIRQECYELNT